MRFKEKGSSAEVLGSSVLTLQAPAPQNGQTQSNDSLAIANELFEYVWLFCGIGS